MTNIIHLVSWHDVLALNWHYFLGDLGALAILWYFSRRLRKFAVNHGKTIVNGIFWILTRLVTRSISAQLSMGRYCRTQLAAESGKYLQVPGLKGTPLAVDEVFVPLTLELGGEDQTFSSFDLPDVGNRLIVVGDPGSGKSTLIKRLHRDTCRYALLAPRRGRLPIRLELRNLMPPDTFQDDNEAGEWLFAQLQNEVEQIEGFEMPVLFKSWVTDAGLMVLLDGLDEVGSERYEKIASAIRGISKKLTALSSDNAIIVTMRIQFFQQVQVQFVEDYPKTLYVRSFLPNEIYLFLNRWPFKSDKERAINKIYGELSDRPTLREMCQNPLVLAMYVESSLESASGDLPNTRTEFYERVVNELLVKRRARQDLMARATGALREQRESFLGRLAFDNLMDSTQPVNALSWKKAIALAEEIWQCSYTEAENRVYDLANETGIISQEKLGESFRFIHQTFCEFLSAIECARHQKEGWNELIKGHKSFVASGEAQLQTRLLEVVPFALALLPPFNRPAALGDVAELNDQLILGRCFLETQLYGLAEWEKYLEIEREFFSKHAAIGWDEYTLRRLQLFSTAVRDSQDWAVDIAKKERKVDLQDVFSSIVKDNRSRIAPIFATYARQDAAAALRLADEVGVDMLVEYPEIIVNSCQEEPFLALVLGRIRSGTREDWGTPLLEAAIRYQSVAHRLDATPAVEHAKMQQNDKRRSTSSLLDLCWVDTGSWYETLTRNALARKAHNDEAFPAVQALLTCRKRANLHKSIWLAGIPLGFIFILGCLVGINYVNPSNSSLINGLIGVVLLTVSIALAGVFFGTSRYTRAIYRDIGNAAPFGGDTDDMPWWKVAFLGKIAVRLILSREIAVLFELEALRPNPDSEALDALGLAQQARPSGISV